MYFFYHCYWTEAMSWSNIINFENVIRMIGSIIKYSCQMQILIFQIFILTTLQKCTLSLLETKRVPFPLFLIWILNTKL